MNDRQDSVVETTLSDFAQIFFSSLGARTEVPIEAVDFKLLAVSSTILRIKIATVASYNVTGREEKPQ